MLITDLKEVEVAIFDVFEEDGNKFVKFNADMQRTEYPWSIVQYSWFEVPIEECMKRGAMNVFNEDGSEYTQYQHDYELDEVLDDDARNAIMNSIDAEDYQYIENTRQYEDLPCGGYVMPWMTENLGNVSAWEREEEEEEVEKIIFKGANIMKNQRTYNRGEVNMDACHISEAIYLLTSLYKNEEDDDKAAYLAVAIRGMEALEEYKLIMRA